MLFKKENPDDPTKYRCIGLLNHNNYKVLSNIILQRLTDSAEKFLSDWQAGFRRGRGCRDNAAILRQVCINFLNLGKRIALTFIDYAAAFDSVSHVFIDMTLKEAKVPNKVRAMFRAVYSAAAAFTTTPGPDGTTAKSDIFSIDRGVVQGDITSPLYFILALEFILRRHDKRQDKGVEFGETVIHTLAYADDAALADAGDEEGIQRTSERVSAIAKGSREDADMEIKISKTKTMHVRKQNPVSETTNEEVIAACKHKCPHLNCKFSFFSRRGLLIHMGKCKWRKEYLFDRILDYDNGIW